MKMALNYYSILVICKTVRSLFNVVSDWYLYIFPIYILYVHGKQVWQCYMKYGVVMRLGTVLSSSGTALKSFGSNCCDVEKSRMEAMFPQR